MNDDADFFDAEEDLFEGDVTNAEFAECEDPYVLHRAAFENDIPALIELLPNHPNKKAPLLDPHGNNALHLAALRGHTQALELLLQAGFTTLQKSGRGWTVLDEALCMGHRAAASAVQAAMASEVKTLMKEKKALLLATMAELPDYSMQLSWQLDSSVPGIGLLVRRYAPSDTYHIWKVGKRIRVDGALMGVDHAASSVLPQWKRGHFSLVYDASGEKPAIWFLNHKKKTYIDVSADRKKLKEGPQDVMDQELGRMAGRPVDRTKVKAAEVRFKPVKGWLGGDMTERVEGWSTKVYEASGRLVTVNQTKEPFKLPADATYEQYLATDFGEDKQVERMLDPFSPDALAEGEEDMAGSRRASGSRASSSGRGGGGGGAGRGKGSGNGKPQKPRYFKGRCWMASDFPMSLRQLLPLLDVVGHANKHVAKVAKFMSKYSDMQQFPVKVQVPLLFTVYALLAFKKFKPLGAKDKDVGEDFFAVPEGYTRRDLQELMQQQYAKQSALEERLRQQELEEQQTQQEGDGVGRMRSRAWSSVPAELQQDLSPEELEALREAQRELLAAAELEDQEEEDQEEEGSDGGRASSDRGLGKEVQKAADGAAVVGDVEVKVNAGAAGKQKG